MDWHHIKKIYDHLYNNGVIHSQKEFAERVGIAPETVSNRLATDSVVAPSTLLKIKKAFPDIFMEDWLLYGKGDMLKIAQPPVKPYAATEEEVSNKDIQSIIDEQKRIISELRQIIEEQKVLLAHYKSLVQSQPRGYSDFAYQNPASANDPLVIVEKQK